VARGGRRDGRVGGAAQGRGRRSFGSAREEGPDVPGRGPGPRARAAQRARLGGGQVTTPNRPERVGQEIQSALADLLSRGKLRDPRIGFITVTGVKVSQDLRVARVFYSMMGTEEQREETQRGLDAAKSFVRREITSQLKLRFSPEIFFSFDKSVSEGDKIDR